MDSIAEKKSKIAPDGQNILEDQRKSLSDASRNMNYVVFLCGPSVKGRTPPANLRRKIGKALEKEGFIVFGGEDDGLERLREDYDLDAQANELQFILNKNVKAIVLIAGSVGSYCELGLFNWLYTAETSDTDFHFIDSNKVAFFLIADQKHENAPSYFNQGPVDNLRDKGRVEFCHFPSFDLEKLLDFLRKDKARKLGSRWIRRV